jgi:threonine/homoserine/homoserine lactone efflux protein
MLLREALRGRRLYQKIQLLFLSGLLLVLMVPRVWLIWMSILAETYSSQSGETSQTPETGAPPLD